MYPATNYTRICIPRQILSIRCLCFFICASFIVFWVEFESTIDNGQYVDDLVEEALQRTAKDFRYYNVYRDKSKLPNNLKYILLWTSYDYAPFYIMDKGQRYFIENNCSMINCYITDDRNFFGGDMTKFDAIAFNGRNLRGLKYWDLYWDLPKERLAHQKYVYVMMESADLYPVCDEMFDNFFNWTFSYRLDATVINPYIMFKNKNGDVVGPRKDMEWVNMGVNDEALPYEHTKTKAAAWFVSNCNSRSKRDEFVKRLQLALSAYGMTVDIYGACGTLKCPRDRKECLRMLEKKYYFYLALENSFDEDYITEKVLTAFNHNVVPIVYGGANYSRFLPPNSYLDARRLTPEQLAATMVQAMKSKELYRRYFWWKRHYDYLDAISAASHNICTLCSTLNNSSLDNETSVYHQFRLYWNPNYEKRCSDSEFQK